MNKEYILASGSPRRKEILTRLGIAFKILVSEADESHGELPPEEIVLMLSRRKAEAVAAIPEAAGYVVIAADTLVALDGEVLGKPADRADYERMIRALSGRAHQVYTGVTLLQAPQGKLKSFYERTDVHVRELSEAEIRAYVDSGEGDDKAGAYAIQGGFAKFIKEIHGEYNNVVGFPIARLIHELKLNGTVM